jgi:hypothetical protein
MASQGRQSGIGVHPEVSEVMELSVWVFRRALAGISAISGMASWGIEECGFRGSEADAENRIGSGSCGESRRTRIGSEMFHGSDCLAISGMIARHSTLLEREFVRI